MESKSEAGESTPNGTPAEKARVTSEKPSASEGRERGLSAGSPDKNLYCILYRKRVPRRLKLYQFVYN